jgi:hypothetical protein
MTFMVWRGYGVINRQEMDTYVKPRRNWGFE